MGEIGGDARLDQYLPLALGGRSCRRAGPWTRSTTAPAVRRAMCACAKPAGGSASSRRSRTISANLQSRAADLLAQLTRCAFRQPMKRSARRACNSRPEGQLLGIVDARRITPPSTRPRATGRLLGAPSPASIHGRLRVLVIGRDHRLRRGLFSLWGVERGARDQAHFEPRRRASC
jgi:hypothetical protein